MTRAERLAMFALKTANGKAVKGSSLITALVEMADRLVIDTNLENKWQILTKEKKAERLIDFLLSYDIPNGV